MGRDKPKKYKNMDYQQKESYIKDQFKEYGSGAVYHLNPRGTSSKGMFNLKASEDALEQKMRNDVDYRISAQHMDGVKGNASIGDFVKYQRGAQQLHKKAGNGGQYSSNEDITTVTNNLVSDAQEQFRDDIMSDMDAKYATAEKLNALQDKIKQRAEQTGPVEISSTLTNAQRGVGEYDDDLTAQGANIFGAVGAGNDLEQATQETMAQEASGDGDEYLTEYKLNVKDGLKLSGIKTRGPESGIRKGEGF